MDAVRISAKFQIVIPKKIRESMKLEPGQQMQIIEYGNHIALIACKSPKSMRRFLGNIDISFARDNDHL